MNLNLLSGSKAPLWNTIAVIIEILMITLVGYIWGNQASTWMAIGSIAWYLPYTVCKWVDRRQQRIKNVYDFKPIKRYGKTYNPRLQVGK